MAQMRAGRRTRVNIRNNDFCALVCKQSRALSADSLPGTCDDGDLAGQHALGVVEVACDLVDAL
jgi:hypothetical protein